MKIVNRQTFLAMPAGTLFAKYAPCYFESLEIKGDTLSHSDDYCYQQIADSIAREGSHEFSSKLDDAQNAMTSLAMDFDCQGRDGCFDAGQMFAVWERADVEALIERLGRALRDTDPSQILPQTFPRDDSVIGGR